MKKNIVLLLSAVFLLLCAACGTSETAEDAVSLAPVSATNAQEPAASDSNARAVSATPPASQTDLAVDTTLYETALEYIGCPVDELFAAIGEPLDSQYAASCEQDCAEDGMLFYDGFYVWSLRTEEEETVYDVYLGD